MLLISCIGAQTAQIYHLALSRAHGWSVLVHTVARHGPLWGILVFACMLAFYAHGGFWIRIECCSLVLLVPKQHKYIVLL